MSHTAVRTGIVAFVLFVIAIGVFGVLLAQTVAKQTLLQEQVLILAKHRAQQDTFFELRRTAEETTDSRNQLQQLFFLRGGDSVDFLNEVEALAPRTGVTVETESLTEIVEADTGDQWLEKSFAITGLHEDVERFVSLLENLPYAVRLTDLMLTERSSTISAADVTLQVRLLQYES